MKCIKCNNEINIKIGSKIATNGCKVLTAITTIVTGQCEKCGAMFQIPISSGSFMSVKNENQNIK